GQVREADGPLRGHSHVEGGALPDRPVADAEQTHHGVLIRRVVKRKVVVPGAIELPRIEAKGPCLGARARARGEQENEPEEPSPPAIDHLGPPIWIIAVRPAKLDPQGLTPELD